MFGVGTVDDAGRCTVWYGVVDDKNTILAAESARLLGQAMIGNPKVLFAIDEVPGFHGTLLTDGVDALFI